MVTKIKLGSTTIVCWYSNQDPKGFTGIIFLLIISFSSCEIAQILSETLRGEVVIN
jgi:hypothetical protein